ESGIHQWLMLIALIADCFGATLGWLGHSRRSIFCYRNRLCASPRPDTGFVMLLTLVALLAAITIAVPLSRRLGLGSILGYLLAGIAIGPAGLRLITDVNQIADVSELGVIMLLFLIGLELRPHRLWVLRKAIFGMGLGQVIPTSLLIAGIAHLFGI